MRLGSSLGSLCEQIRINVKFLLILKNYTWLNLWLSMGNFSVCSESNINQFSNLLFRVLAAKYWLWSNRAWVLKSWRVGQRDLVYFHAGNGYMLCVDCPLQELYLTCTEQDCQMSSETNFRLNLHNDFLAYEVLPPAPQIWWLSDSPLLYHYFFLRSKIIEWGMVSSELRHHAVWCECAIVSEECAIFFGVKDFLKTFKNLLMKLNLFLTACHIPAKRTLHYHSHGSL